MRYAIAGLGPVGRRIALAASSLGHEVLWYDPSPSLTAEWSRAASVAELVQGADRFVSAVPGPEASVVARAVSDSGLTPAIYEDWASATPDEKRRVGEAVGGPYLDVALLDSITATEPLICLAGSSSRVVAPELEALGFAVLIAGDNPGEAALVKMVRSLFMKPFEAIAIEAVRTSLKWDASGSAIASIDRTLGTNLRSLSDMLLETNRQHAARRARELSDANSSVGLPSGDILFRAAATYLSDLSANWSDLGAPPVGASATELLDFLSSKEPRPDGH
ncbi:MAG: hypothetical protein M3P18_18540 [Actinomycetota bacterium]|nr:hypothetical protein [Actinomycetota bacterium]